MTSPTGRHGGLMLAAIAVAITAVTITAVAFADPGTRRVRLSHAASGRTGRLAAPDPAQRGGRAVLPARAAAAGDNDTSATRAKGFDPLRPPLSASSAAITRGLWQIRAVAEREWPGGWAAVPDVRSAG
jgi:hypothetical protein